MKTIGLIGGMSWESSAEYYKLANQKTNNLYGGFASCKCLMYSVDFAQIEALQHQGNWDQLNQIMADAAINLHKGGADIILLCTNTMHLCSPAIIDSVPIPFLHIVDATGEAISNYGQKKVGLLGTKFTMEKDFYKSHLIEKFGIETIIPNAEEREQIHNVIYTELVKGQFNEQSKTLFLNVIQNLIQNGAEGIILGCTEIPLLISQDDVNIKLYDTTDIHIGKAVHWASVN